MSLHLFVIAKDGTCAPLGAFVDRHEARPVFAKSGAVAGIYTLDNGVVLSTVAEPSAAQLSALKAFALSVLTGASPTQPAPAPAPKRAKVLRDVAARAARLDDENARLRVVRAADRAELAHVEPEEGEPDALGLGATTEPPPRPAFAERAADLRARLAETPPPAVVVPAPRYDETFVEGSAWLDAQAEAPRCGTTHHHDCDCQRDARGEPRVDAASELDRLRALLADETAARVAAERERDQLAAVAADVAALRERAEFLAGVADEARLALRRERADHDLTRAVLDVERTALAAAREHAARIEAERDGLAASLRERSDQVDALRRAPRAKPVRVRKAPPAAPAPVPAHPIAAIREALARRAR